jgi:hypothetical protein
VVGRAPAGGRGPAAPRAGGLEAPDARERAGWAELRRFVREATPQP